MQTDLGLPVSRSNPLPTYYQTAFLSCKHSHTTVELSAIKQSSRGHLSPHFSRPNGPFYYNGFHQNKAINYSFLVVIPLEVVMLLAKKSTKNLWRKCPRWCRSKMADRGVFGATKTNNKCWGITLFMQQPAADGPQAKAGRRRHTILMTMIKALNGSWYYRLSDWLFVVVPGIGYPQPI